MVTAKDVRFIVRKTRAMKPKVIATFVVRVWLADPKMCRQHCKTKNNIGFVSHLRNLYVVNCHFARVKLKLLLFDF